MSSPMISTVPEQDDTLQDMDDALATRLERTGSYRLLRRLPDPTFSPSAPISSGAIAVVSCIRTGPGCRKDSTGAAIAVGFDHLGLYPAPVRVRVPSFRSVEPHDPSDDPDTVDLRTIIDRVRLSISFEASDALDTLRKDEPVLQTIPRISVRTAIPWSVYGIDGSGLDTILLHHRLFADTSSAAGVCKVLHAILSPYLWEGHVTHPFSYLLRAVSQEQVRVEITGDTYRWRDALKSRGYRFQGKETGRQPCWVLRAPHASAEREVRWVFDTCGPDVAARLLN